jgi:hypothetical protein
MLLLLLLLLLAMRFNTASSLPDSICIGRSHTTTALHWAVC